MIPQNPKMSDSEVENSESVGVSRPTLAQVRAVVEFMQKHPDLAHKKLRVGMGRGKFKKIWMELAKTANSVGGAVKSSQGWIKYWADKRRSVMIKKRQIEEGKLRGRITIMEQKILDLCNEKSLSPKKRGKVKEEPCNGGDGDSLDGFLSKDEEYGDIEHKHSVTENDERHLNIIDKLVEVMNQQAAAMNQLAHTSLCNSKALERVAEASHIQALAVDRLANTFETISASVQDVRNAVIGIDYTVKRCYPVMNSQRTNANIIFG